MDEQHFLRSRATAWSLLQTGRTDQASRIVGDLLTVRPDDAVLHFLRAKTERLAGRRDEAERSAAVAAAAPQTHAVGLALHAQIILDRKDLRRAEEVARLLSASIAADPRQWGPYVLRVHSFAMQQRFTEFADAAEQALTVLPDAPQDAAKALMNVATLYGWCATKHRRRRREFRERAATLARRAVQLGPGDAWIWVQRARIALFHGSDPRAAVFVLRGLRLNPAQPQAAELLDIAVARVLALAVGVVFAFSLLVGVIEFVPAIPDELGGRIVSGVRTGLCVTLLLVVAWLFRSPDLFGSAWRRVRRHARFWVAAGFTVAAAVSFAVLGLWAEMTGVAGCIGHALLAAAIGALRGHEYRARARLGTS